jgi:hypothetical protein
MGFTPPLLKKTGDACCKWATAFFTLLLHCHVAFLHHTATCRPLFKPRVSLLSIYKTIELYFKFLLHFYVSHLTLPHS